MTSLKFVILFLGFTFLSFPSAHSADSIPTDLIGQYGFDWLHPAKARCTAITEGMRSQFKSCKYNGPGDTGSFTGKAEFTTCKAGPKVEYMIYKTKARCAEEIETMQANGP